MEWVHFQNGSPRLDQLKREKKSYLLVNQAQLIRHPILILISDSYPQFIDEETLGCKQLRLHTW